MGRISGSERLERLRDIAATAQMHDGVNPPALIAAACRKWGITNKTAREYVEVLTDSKVLAYDPPGSGLHLTEAGAKWLEKTDADFPGEGQISIVNRPKPAADHIELLPRGTNYAAREKAREARETPPPPSSEGGEG